MAEPPINERLARVVDLVRLPNQLPGTRNCLSFHNLSVLVTWLKTAAVVAATNIAFAGCNQCGASQPSGGGQNLVFTGPAAGSLTTADTSCQVHPSQKQLNFLLTGTLAGQDLTFNIQVYAGYVGPDSYQVGSLLDGSGNLRLQIGSYVGDSSTGAGTLTIDSDGKSGSVDADLSGGEHVKGSFRCDEVITG